MSRRRLQLSALIVALSAVASVATHLALTPTPTGSPEGDDRGPSNSEATDEPRRGAPSTRRMAERLAKIAAAVDPAETPYLNRRRAEIYRTALRPGLRRADEIDLRMRLGTELLNAGASRDATREFESVLTLTGGLGGEEADTFRWLAHHSLALSFLRIAEQENCVARHTSASCLLPIGVDGVHTRTQGSRRAIEHFEKALALHPNDPGSTWLLNIAYMTLGEHPDGVPSRWRIPPETFASDGTAPRFLDVAPAVGLATLGLSGGSIVEDLDGDGLLDVACSSWGLRDPLRIFRNAGDGSFVEATREAGLDGIVGGLNLVHADYDNDGDADILVLRGAWMGSQGRHPNSLLRNDGGRFVDVTEETGLLSMRPTQTAAWGDFDGDGWLDLFVGNESGPGSRNPCELFRGDGDGTFTECARSCGVDHVGMVKGVAWGDYDNDGRVDLFLSCLDEENVLYRNAGPDEPWRFENRTQGAGVSEPRRSFPTWFFDYDNDGWLDLFVASYDWESSTRKVAIDFVRGDGPGARPRLYHNQKDGTFLDATEAAGLSKVLVAMGANFGDIDGDGFHDLCIGTGEPDLAAVMPNRVFRCHEGESFHDVTTAAGLGHLQKGHGVSFADIDGDGDQDIYTVLGGAYEGDAFQNALFENPGTGSHWLTLRLEGVDANRAAVGARVEIRLPQGRAYRRICRVVGTGGSFGSSSLQLEVGLGRATRISEVRIRWPGSGRQETLHDVPVDRVVRVREGEGRVHVVDARRFTLRRP